MPQDLPHQNCLPASPRHLVPHRPRKVSYREESGQWMVRDTAEERRPGLVLGVSVI